MEKRNRLGFRRKSLAMKQTTQASLFCSRRKNSGIRTKWLKFNAIFWCVWRCLSEFPKNKIQFSSDCNSILLAAQLVRICENDVTETYSVCFTMTKSITWECWLLSMSVFLCYCPWIGYFILAGNDFFVNENVVRSFSDLWKLFHISSGERLFGATCRRLCLRYWSLLLCWDLGRCLRWNCTTRM